MRPEKVLAELKELRLLRKVALKIPEYKQENIRVLIEFRQRIQAHDTRLKLNDIAADIIRKALPDDEMRVKMAAKVAARIAVLEARYPGLVDEE